MPFVKLVSESVLVESFEAGDAVSRYIQAPESINSSIVNAGVEIYLKMLLQEGFVHSDMHPGNLLCAALEGDKPSIALLDCGLAEQLSPEVCVGPAACRDCIHTRCVVVLLAECTANAYSICIVSKSPHCRLRWECKQCFEREPGSRLLRRFWSRAGKVVVEPAHIRSWRSMLGMHAGENSVRLISPCPRQRRWGRGSAKLALLDG